CIMPLQLDLAPLAGFVALMATAAFEDFRRLVIPNLVIVGLCILWPFHLATAPGATLASGLTAIGCGLAVFFAGPLLFARGLVRGGDVKLIAAAALWAGAGGTLPLLVLTGVLGGFLGLFALLPIHPHVLGVRWRDPAGPSNVVANPANPIVVPYGAAIAAAALIVTVPPSFS